MLLFFLILSSFVRADVLATIGDPVFFTWNIPTKTIDGSEFPRSNLKSYSLSYSCISGYSGVIEDMSPDIPQIEYRNSLLKGVCIFSVRANDIFGQSSNRSNEVKVIYRLPKPTNGGIRNG